MAYLGRQPVLGNFVKLDAITVVNGQAAYTMQNSGVNFTSYDNVNQFLVSLNGILQAPTDSFTVSGSTLTFASNLATGDVIDFVMVLGNTLDIGTPSDNTVTTAKLADSSVSLAKLTATGTKDATTFLRGDNTFSTITAGITEADLWRINANFDLPNSNTVISSGWERSDQTTYTRIGTGMSESSGIFTFPSTGIWNIRFIAQSYSTNYAATNATAYIQSTTNNSTYNEEARAWLGYEAAGGNPPSRCHSSCETIIDVTDTSNVKVRFAGVDNDNTDFGLEGSTNANVTHALFIRLGDT